MNKVIHSSSRFLSIFVTLLALSACSESTKVSNLDVATSFVLAVNQNNSGHIIPLTGAPLSIRNQEWESATDGKGFVLGKAQDTQLADQNQIRNFFEKNIRKIGVEGTTPAQVTHALLKTELSGIENQWQGLELYLFMRGMGDVEHIFVLGINSNRKVSAIYYN